jgi:SAM-dependent methyltransferase
MKRYLKALSSPKFIGQYLGYRSLAKAAGTTQPSLSRIRPILDEATPQTGFDKHYVYHTGWAARILAETRPEHHVDIGSSLFFVSIASAHTPITHYDYRPPEIDLPNVKTGSADLTSLPFDDDSIESLSCMHVLEHNGLGRYGDALDAEGDVKAMKELTRVLAPGGQLLFATPAGQPRVVFNAHRVHSHEQVLEGFSGLEMKRFALITDGRHGGQFFPDADPALVAQQRYGCSCYLFTKPV